MLTGLSLHCGEFFSPCHVLVFSFQRMLKKVTISTAARSVTFSPDGEKLAVGLKNGEFLILKTESLEVWARKRDRSKSIQDLK